jgi:hypothetical protein
MTGMTPWNLPSKIVCTFSRLNQIDSAKPNGNVTNVQTPGHIGPVKSNSKGKPKDINEGIAH